MVDCGTREPLGLLVERLRRRAFEAGLARGMQDAREGEASALNLAGEKLEESRQESCDSLSRSAVEIALVIVKELLRSEIKNNRHDIEEMVRDTLQSASAGRASCTVHLNPGDLEALEGVEFRSGTILKPDIGVPRGDVHVETTLGLMVRELDAALDSIAERLREMLE